MHFHSIPLELKASSAGEGTFNALAASFGNVDRTGDTIAPGAFANTLNDWKARGGKIPLLWQHDDAHPIGGIQTAQETSKGLEVSGKLALDGVDNARRAHDLMKTGGVSLSIGYTIPRGGAEVMKSTGVRLLKNIDLHEVSVVSIPADPSAVIRSVKSARDLEDLLRDHAGFSQRQAKRFITAGRAALLLPDDDEMIAQGSEALAFNLDLAVKRFTLQLEKL